MSLAGWLVLTAAVWGLAAGCSQQGTAAQSEGAEGADQSQQRRPVVVATTTMIADLAGVLGGEQIELVSIMKVGEDPHVYDVRPRDAQAIAGADLVLMNGLHLEATLLHVIEHNARGKVVKLAESPQIKPLTWAQGSGAMDPHAWMSVPNFKAYAQAARDALIELDPAHADLYRQRAQDYLRQLDELDAWIRQQFAAV
ncbi:MAG TPA: zinc ABC transporter substrate-binding protein, partial [Phycisphaeraceae bacterium]